MQFDETNHRSVRAFVQARMSSARFPGKVLAPFRGRPMLDHVVTAAESALGEGATVVLTSREPSDDPVAAYCGSLGVPVCRGPLEDVLGRFIVALDAWPCDWVVRLCADSPLASPAVIRAVRDAAIAERADVATTTRPRTFPAGLNAECVRAGALRAADRLARSTEDREHVTAWFYARADAWRVAGVRSTDPALGSLSLAVDTVDDLRRLEGLPSPLPWRIAVASIHRSAA